MRCHGRREWRVRAPSCPSLVGRVMRRLNGLLFPHLDPQAVGRLDQMSEARTFGLGMRLGPPSIMIIYHDDRIEPEPRTHQGRPPAGSAPESPNWPAKLRRALVQAI